MKKKSLLQRLEYFLKEELPRSEGKVLSRIITCICIAAALFKICDFLKLIPSSFSRDSSLQSMVEVFAGGTIIWLGLYLREVLIKLLETVSRIRKVRVRNKIEPLKDHSKPTKIHAPPAGLLMKLAGVLPKKQRQCIEQEISDMRIEYYEAMAEKKLLRARTRLICYYIGLGWSAFTWAAGKLAEVVKVASPKD